MSRETSNSISNSRDVCIIRKTSNRRELSKARRLAKAGNLTIAGTPGMAEIPATTRCQQQKGPKIIVL
jgi:hypothetical protein